MRLVGVTVEHLNARAGRTAETAVVQRRVHQGQVLDKGRQALLLVHQGPAVAAAVGVAKDSGKHAVIEDPKIKLFLLKGI